MNKNKSLLSSGLSFIKNIITTNKQPVKTTPKDPPRPIQKKKVRQKHIPRQHNGIDSSLYTEIDTLFKSRVSRYTHTTINEHYRNCMLKIFPVFDKFVAKIDPSCPRNSLTCYTQEHARKFKMELEKEGQTSPFTGEKVTKGYLSGIAIHTRNIFTYAKEAGLIATNPFDGIEIPKYRSKQSSPDYLTTDIIDKLSRIDYVVFEKMDITGKYLYLLPKVMIRIGYEIAARSCEIVKICIEDILLEKKRTSGLIPIQIIGGKQRPAGFIDIVWVQADHIESILNLWLKIRSEYLAKHNIKDLPIDIPRRQSQGRPLFEHPKSFQLLDNSTSYKSIFKNLFEENSLPKHLWGRTHLMRISRITNWVLEAWDFYDIHKNARHAKFEESERYVRGNSEDRAIRIEKNLQLNKIPTINNFKLPDEQNMSFLLFKFIEMVKQSNIDINDSSRIPVLVTNLYRHISSDLSETKSSDYYTMNDLKVQWDLKSSQTWRRLNHLENAGLIHSSKSKNGQTLVPKIEIDNLSMKYVPLAKVPIVFGINSKGKINHIRKLAVQGKIEAIKVFKLWYLSRKSLEDWLISNRESKNGQNLN